MPKVPVYEQQVRQSAFNPGNVSVDAPKGAFGGGLSDVVNAGTNLADERLGELAKIQAKQKEEADEFAAQDAERRLSEAKSNILYNPKTGAYNVKGKEVLGLPDSSMEAYNKSADEIAESLSNDRQKAMFLKSRRTREAELYQDVQKHVSTEFNKYDQDSTQAYLKNEEQDAVANYNNPARIETSLERQRQTLALFGQRQGMDAGQIEQSIRQAEAKTHQAVVDRMLDNGLDLDAKKYFEQNKESIEKAGDVGNLEKRLKEGSLLGESQRMTNAWEASKVPYDKQIVEAKKIKDPQLQENVIKKVRENESIFKQQKKDYIDQTEIGFLNKVDQGASLDDIKRSAQWQNLDYSARQHIESQYENKIKGIPQNTNWEKYYDVKLALSNPETRDKFISTVSYAELKSSLADAEFKEVVGLIAGTKKSDPKTNKELDTFRNQSGIISGAITGVLKYDPKRNASEIEEFKKIMANKQAEFQTEHKRKMTDEEFQNMVDQQTTQVITDKGFFSDTTKKVYQLNDEEIGNIKYESIPKEMSDRIRSKLIKNGKPSSDEDVANVYKAYIVSKR